MNPKKNKVIGINRREFFKSAAAGIAGSYLALNGINIARSDAAEETTKSPRVISIAHRGASGYAPENTLSAYKKAIEMGVDGAECDVYCTKDGHVVLMHDSNLKRTTNMQGNVSDMTLAELRKADAGLWFDSKFAGEPIPTLKEYLELLKGKILAVVEIKQEGITDKVIRDIEDTGMLDQSIIISFNESSLRDVRDMKPEIPRALLIGGSEPVSDFTSIMNMIHKAAVLGAGTLNLSRKIITPQLVREAELRGMNVWSWTIDNEEEIRRLVDMGVSGITSNFPERVKSAIS